MQVASRTASLRLLLVGGYHFDSITLWSSLLRMKPAQGVLESMEEQSWDWLVWID